MNYLPCVEITLFFIAASRNADITLKLQASEATSKLFFEFDRIKYKRLWPRYIAYTHELESDLLETWSLKQATYPVTRVYPIRVHWCIP